MLSVIHPRTAHLYQHHLLVFSVYEPSVNSVGSYLEVLRENRHIPPCRLGTQVWAGLVNTRVEWRPPADSS